MALLATEELVLMSGDDTVIPQPQDAAKPGASVVDALFLPDTPQT